MFKRLVFLFAAIAVFSQAHAFSTKSQYAFLIDATTGKILYDKAGEQRMTPSSMSKLMTLYIVFDRLKNGAIKLEDNMLVSTKAWRMGGTKMFLSPNTQVSVENLLRGVIVHSGNDACIVLAEGIAGDEKDFVALMNSKATELELKNSQFANATGMPDKGHFMSAADIVKLSDRIIKDFPEYYHYFAERDFLFNNIRQSNRNTLLGINGVDGLKTGHTDAGRYGISISALTNNRRLIAVVNGLRDEKERYEEAQRLLQHGFLNFANVIISSDDVHLGDTEVSLGESKKVNFRTKQPLVLTIPTTNRGQTEVTVTYKSKLEAPITTEQKVGEVSIKLYDGNTYNFDLYPSKAVEKLGFFKKIYIIAKSWIKNFNSKESEPSKKIRIFVV